MKRMWSEEELKKMIEQGGGGGSSDVTASDIDSEEATAGQVLTANGEGGASWEDASGGKLYKHSIYAFSGSTGRFYLEIINNVSSPYTSISEVEQYLRSLNKDSNTYLAIASGFISPSKYIFALYSSGIALMARSQEFTYSDNTVKLSEKTDSVNSYTFSRDLVAEI